MFFRNGTYLIDMRGTHSEIHIVTGEGKSALFGLSVLRCGHLGLLLEAVHRWWVRWADSLARTGCSLQRVFAEAVALHHTALCQITNPNLLFCLCKNLDRYKFC